MNYPMEEDLLNLIEKYDLTKYNGKFASEGITSCRHIKDIDQYTLRSYYNMLQVDLRNFEKLRNECIQICALVTPIIVPHNPLDKSDVNLGIVSGKSRTRLNYNSIPRVSYNASNFIQDGTYLLDYHTEKPVGKVKMKGSTPFILTFPDKVIIQDETLLCDFLHTPVCELKVKNGTTYVVPFTNIENEESNFSSINIPPKQLAMPTIPQYDGSLVEGHKGLGIIIACDHIEKDIGDRSAIRKEFTTLFQMFNLRIVYVNDMDRKIFILSLKKEITKAFMKIFFIGIFSHRQDQDGAKVKLHDGNFIGLNEIFEILKESIPIELPKVIIIQACHSEEDDTLMSSDHNPVKPYNASIMESNYLVTYSHVGVYKNPEQSSWYIQTLRRAYNEIRDQSDFIHVLIRTNELMLSGNKEGASSDVYRQPVQIESTLTRLLYV